MADPGIRSSRMSQPSRPNGSTVGLPATLLAAQLTLACSDRPPRPCMRLLLNTSIPLASVPFHASSPSRLQLSPALDALQPRYRSASCTLAA